MMNFVNLYLYWQKAILKIITMNTMQTITIELTGNNSLEAIKDLEEKHLIRILKVPDLNSYTLHGETFSVEDFKKWIEFSEESEILSFTEAKRRWAEQKEKLQKLIR